MRQALVPRRFSLTANIGPYALALIRRRKASWLHAGSTPAGPTERERAEGRVHLVGNQSVLEVRLWKEIRALPYSSLSIIYAAFV